MPAGTYRVMDGDGAPRGTERFRSGPGPAGWRYFSTVEYEDRTDQVDLSVDARGIPVRARIETGAHSILLSARGDRLVGLRDGEPVEIAWGQDRHLDYLSPCFNAATVVRLEGPAEIDVVYLDEGTCVPRDERQRYEPLGEEEIATPVGAFRAAAWRYTALRTGWSRRLWVARDLVVAYEGLYELIEYEALSTGPRPVS